MKQTRDLMGMTITVEIVDDSAEEIDADKVFEYFDSVEKRFSVFKEDSEITLINNSEINQSHYSEDMKTVFALAEKTKPGDLVIVVPGYNSLPLDYYYASAKSQTREYKATSAEDLERISSERGNSTMYFVVTRAIEASNPNGDAVAWLENNTHFAGMDTTKGIYLFTSPKSASAPNYNLTIIIPSVKEASNIGAIIKEVRANFFSGNATNWEILIEVNNSPDRTLLTGK